MVLWWMIIYITIGYPLNINIHTPINTHGKISGIAENGLLIINGSFNKGNSGGALFNENGNVVGVVVATATSIPPQLRNDIDLIKNVLNSGIMIATKNINSIPNNEPSNVIASHNNEIIYRPLDSRPIINLIDH